MTNDSNNENEINNTESELAKKLDLTEKNANEYSDFGRGIVKDGQDIIDYVHSIRGVTKYYQPPEDIEIIIDGLDKINNQLGFQKDKTGKINLGPVVSTTAGSVVSFSSDLFDKEKAKGRIYSENWPKVEMAIDNYHALPERISNKNEVIELMKKLGLDKSFHGHKSPLELFITAHIAYEEPITSKNPVITSLIPVRESIRLIIDILLKARPIQEKASSEREKIISIGKQLKFDEIDIAIVISWADQWFDSLDKELSPSKQEELSREEWRNRLNKSTLFIKNILSGLDINKMRR